LETIILIAIASVSGLIGAIMQYLWSNKTHINLKVKSTETEVEHFYYKLAYVYLRSLLYKEEERNYVMTQVEGCITRAKTELFLPKPEHRVQSNYCFIKISEKTLGEAFGGSEGKCSEQ